MKGVHMDNLVSVADAYRAALASLLELDLDEVPAYEGMAAGLQFEAWLASQLNLLVWRVPADAAAPPMGLWLARVRPHPYQGLDLHTVVCQGTMVQWDPHPEGVLMDPASSFTVVQVELMVPLDVAAPCGAAALHGA